MTTVTITVSEIHCGGCENTIRTAMCRLEGVRGVRPDHRTSQVRIAEDLRRVRNEVAHGARRLEPGGVGLLAGTEDPLEVHLQLDRVADQPLSRLLRLHARRHPVVSPEPEAQEIFSSRSESGSASTGGFIASRATTCSGWFWITSRIAPTPS